MTCSCFFFTTKLKFFLGMAFQCSSHSTIFLGIKKNAPSLSLVSWGFLNSGPCPAMVDEVNSACSSSHPGPV